MTAEERTLAVLGPLATHFVIWPFVQDALDLDGLTASPRYRMLSGGEKVIVEVARDVLHGAEHPESHDLWRLDATNRARITAALAS